MWTRNVFGHGMTRISPIGSNIFVILNLVLNGMKELREIRGWVGFLNRPPMEDSFRNDNGTLNIVY